MSRAPLIEAQLKQVFSDVSGLPVAELTRETSFVDQGFDSLSLTQATMEIERVFGLKLRFRRLLEDLDNVARLAALFDQELPAGCFAPTPSLQSGNAVHQLIQLQLQLMAQQVALLSDCPAPMAAFARSPSLQAGQAFAPEQHQKVDGFTAPSETFSHDKRELKAGPSAVAGSNPTGEEPIMEAVQRAMADLLMRPHLGPDENFFAAGGHSLLAARLSTRLAESGLPRPGLRPIFEQPTARRLAGWLTRQQRAAALDGARRVHVREDQSSAPMSLMQQRMWFLEQLSPGTAVNHLHCAHWLKGPLNREAFQRAFLAMVHRQSVLRTHIEEEGDALRQRILPHLEGDLLHFEDMSHLAPHEREPQVQRRCAEWVARPFDLLQAPLFRAALFRVDDQAHVLFFVAHHIIWDAGSFDVMYAELAAHYSALVQGMAPALPALTVSYGDFSAWQREWLNGEELQRQTAHWVKKLSPLPEPLDLPSSRKRPKRMSGGGHSFQLDMSGTALDRLALFAAEQGTTLYVSLLAVYALALHQISEQSDLCIGAPVRGRESSELDPLMGFFVNMLPMRLTLASGTSVGEWVRQVHQEVQAAFEAPDVPFEHLVRELNPPRDLSRPPLHQASFSFQDVRERPLRWGDLALGRLPTPIGSATQDLSLWCVRTKDLLEFAYTFNTDLFDEADCRLFAERLLGMVERLPDAAHLPARHLLAPLPWDRARQQAWNATDAAYDRSATVHSVIAAQAARTPGAPAVLQPRFGELSYGELQKRSNRLAHALRMRGVARGALVGLCVERDLDMPVAQLAILKAGAAYVPLDPTYPSDRLAHMAGDAQLALLVSTSSLVHALPWPREKTLLLDIDAASIASQPDAALPPDAARDARPLDPAYVIYTSGSTGTPKGVVVHHQAVVNFLASMAREPGLKASDTLLAVTTLSFDIAVLELLLPLTVGAKIVLTHRDDVLDGDALAAMIAQHGVTTLQATPSSWRMFIESGWGRTSGLKALVGGESLPVDLAEQLLERCDELWNLYGPTETTVWSTCWRVAQPQRGIRIGRPIANTTVHILDELLQPCPIGVPGEICIGGEGVAMGYHQRPELTAERFIADPERPGSRLYRTGDRGRWCHDGTLEHFGRKDFQVKVRGRRIEPGEIESQLMDHPSIAQALVIAREDHPGDQRLVAYLVAKPAVAMEVAALRAHLKTRLPDDMLPQHFVEIDRIPLLPNGKVNRQALPVPNADQEAMCVCADVAGPGNATEQAIAAIWARLLTVTQVGRNDNFFNLGGHSLLALLAVQEIQRITGAKIAISRLIFESLSQIAAGIAAAPASPGPIASLPADIKGGATADNESPTNAFWRQWLRRLWSGWT